MKAISMPNLKETKSTTILGNTDPQWSRRTRYTLGIPLIAMEMPSIQQQTPFQMRSLFYLPSGSYRNWPELEHDICNTIFGALYRQGEKTNFAMYADVEVLCRRETPSDSQGEASGYDDQTQHRTALTEDNWKETLQAILSLRVKEVELIASWRRSKKLGRVSKDLSKTPTPSSFPAPKSLTSPSSKASSPSRSNHGTLLKRPSMTGTVSIRSHGSRSGSSSKSRVDSGQDQQLFRRKS